MTETGFGPGGYVYTAAVVPSAPTVEPDTPTTLTVTPGEDENPAVTRYAVYNATDGLYLDADGAGTTEAVWRTKAEWGTITATGLTPDTAYTFTVKALNQADVETEFGPASDCTTSGLSSDLVAILLTVRKASSTISAPAFMSGLPTSIRLAGKSLNELGFHVDRISGLDVPRVVPDEELVPGDHTWQIRDEYFSPKRIVLEGHIHGSSAADLQIRLAYLKSFLSTFEGNPWRSTAPVRLERSDLPDRHWMVYYDAIDLVEIIGKRGLSSSARVRVAVKCPAPFAFSNEVVRVVFAPAAGTFRTIDLGNAPSDAVFVITGSAESPSFSVGDSVFHCDFSGGLAFTDTENAVQTGTYTPEENEAGAYRTTETGTGILVSGTDTVSFTVTGNKDDGSWAAVIAPQWQSTARETDAVILEHCYDTDNYLRLYWDAAEDRWVFRKRASGADIEVSSEPQAFTAGTRIVLGFTWDSTNAGGMKLYINGQQTGVNGDMTALASNPVTLTLHSSEGAMQPEAVIDFAAGWSRMLSADEMLRIATDPGTVANHNETAAYAGTLGENDLLTLDSRLKTAELFDISAGTRTNALGSVTGSIPILVPGRKRTASDRTQTVIYSTTAAAKFEVRYRRRYL